MFPEPYDPHSPSTQDTECNCSRGCLPTVPFPGLLGELPAMYAQGHTERLQATAYRGEVLQHLSVLVLALRVAPVWVVQEGMEALQQGHLLLQANGHVIFQRVQGPENEVKHTHSVAAKSKGCFRWNKQSLVLNNT